MSNPSQPLTTVNRRPALEYHQQVTNCLDMLRDWNSSDMLRNRYEGWLHLKRVFPGGEPFEAGDLIDDCQVGYVQTMAVLKFIDALVILIEEGIIDKTLAIALFRPDIDDWVIEFGRIQVPATFIPQHDAHKDILKRVRKVVDKWPTISGDGEASIPSK
jgi:hypothetical protein